MHRIYATIVHGYHHAHFHIQNVLKNDIDPRSICSQSLADYDSRLLHATLWNVMCASRGRTGIVSLKWLVKSVDITNLMMHLRICWNWSSEIACVSNLFTSGQMDAGNSETSVAKPETIIECGEDVELRQNKLQTLAYIVNIYSQKRIKRIQISDSERLITTSETGRKNYFLLTPIPWWGGRSPQGARGWRTGGPRAKKTRKIFHENRNPELWSQFDTIH